MAVTKKYSSLSLRQAVIKRVFDIVFALLGLVLSGWLILLVWLATSLETRSNGLFTQARIGKDGKQFILVKIKTMRSSRELTTTVTRSGDPRITPLGRFFRKTKLDELPQLWNVLVGDMSFVGPRPDVPGFADLLEGEAALILSVRPGITGPASLAFRDEESLLAAQCDPERYNREVIYPRKVQLNLDYIRTWSLGNDIKYIWHTLFG